MLITNIIIAVCTAAYVWINYKSWKESIATRKQKTTPLIIAFLETTESHTMMALHIKNIGEGLAKNVKVKILKDYNIMGKAQFPLSNIGIVKNGLDIFPPQYELKYCIHWLEELFGNYNCEKEQNNNINIEICFESMDRREFKYVYELWFNQLSGQSYSNPPETFMGQIPFYLKEIHDTLKKK